MYVLHKIITGVFLISVIVNGQQFVGDLCTLQSSRSEGECKLLSDCPSAGEELKKNKRFPQICGFHKDNLIVCCPKADTVKVQRLPGEISIEKCKNYSRYAIVKRRSSTLLIDAPEVVKNECGHKVVTLIVGGEKAGRKEFPHMAAIGYEPTPGSVIKYLCGGTILSEEYILTAGHCLSHHYQGDAKWVKLGVASLNARKNKQEIKVLELIPHPEYKTNSHYHDIGLIKLEKPATLSQYAIPACLYINKEINAQRAIASGWGVTSYDEGVGSNELLKVVLDLFDYQLCKKKYQSSRKLKNGIMDDVQLCAGSLDEEEKDTCQGDSGGPLQIYHVGDDIKCMYDIIGVTSFGKSCGNQPGVYVRVSHYVKWIEDIIWPQ